MSFLDQYNHLVPMLLNWKNSDTGTLTMVLSFVTLSPTEASLR